MTDVCMYLLYKRKINAKRVAYGHQTLYHPTSHSNLSAPDQVSGDITKELTCVLICLDLGRVLPNIFFEEFKIVSQTNITLKQD